MKSSFRSTSKPARPARVAILGAGPPDARFISRLNAALSASGHILGTLVSSANMPATDGRTHDLTLVMGLEGSSETLRAVDSTIRSALAKRSTDYHVLYGSTDERLSQALRVIRDKLLPGDEQGAMSLERKTCNHNTWVWACDKCGDPECEHRLLTDLLDKKNRADY